MNNIGLEVVFWTVLSVYLLAKIGQPKRVKEEGIPIVKYDLTPYGIFDDE